MALFQILFILVLPLVMVAGGLVSLFAVGALFDALENPEALRTRIEGAFRTPGKSGPVAGREHYYQPYWTRP